MVPMDRGAYLDLPQLAISTSSFGLAMMLALLGDVACVFH